MGAIGDESKRQIQLYSSPRALSQRTAPKSKGIKRSEVTVKRLGGGRWQIRMKNGGRIIGHIIKMDKTTNVYKYQKLSYARPSTLSYSNIKLAVLGFLETM